MSSSSIYIAMYISQREIDLTDISIKSCFNVYFIIDNSYEKHNLFEDMYIYERMCRKTSERPESEKLFLFNL